MRKALPLVLTLGLIATAGALAARVFSPEPRYDPVAAQAEALAMERAEALAPLWLLLEAGWALLPFVALVGALVIVGRWAWLRLRIVRIDGAPIDLARLDDVTPAVLSTYGQARVLEAQRPNTPHTITFSPHYSARNDHAPMLEAPEPEAPPLPGIVDLADIAHTPSAQSVLLGLGPGGAPITVPLKQMVHAAFLGSTGGGKTNLMRLIVPQILAIGGRVVLADPHYTDLDPESGDDWRPIRQRLHMAPAVAPSDIDAMFSYLLDELERRLELRRNGQPVGAPLFLALDELPVIVDSVRDVPERLGKLLREGRKVSILSIGASQEFLVKVIGGTSAAREAYRTAFYTGGDLVSARALLDMPQREIAEGALHTGVAYLRSAATSPAQLVRVPLASNRAIRAMLTDDAPTMERLRRADGISDGPVNAAPYAASMPVQGHFTAASEVAQTAAQSHKAPSAEAVKVAGMFLEGKEPSQIVAELRNVTSNQAGKYQAALREIHTLLREGLRS